MMPVQPDSPIATLANTEGLHVYLVECNDLAATIHPPEPWQCSCGAPEFPESSLILGAPALADHGFVPNIVVQCYGFVGGPSPSNIWSALSPKYPAVNGFRTISSISEASPCSANVTGSYTGSDDVDLYADCRYHLYEPTPISSGWLIVRTMTCTVRTYPGLEEALRRLVVSVDATIERKFGALM